MPTLRKPVVRKTMSTESSKKTIFALDWMIIFLSALCILIGMIAITAMTNLDINNATMQKWFAQKPATTVQQPAATKPTINVFQPLTIDDTQLIRTERVGQFDVCGDISYDFNKFYLLHCAVSNAGDRLVYTIVAKDGSGKHFSQIKNIKDGSGYALVFNERNNTDEIDFLPEVWSKNDKVILGREQAFLSSAKDNGEWPYLGVVLTIDPLKQMQTVQTLVNIDRAIIFDQFSKVIVAESVDSAPMTTMLPGGTEGRQGNLSRLVLVNIETGKKTTLVEKPYRNYIVTPDVTVQNLSSVRYDVEKFPVGCASVMECQSKKEMVKNITTMLP